MSEIIRGPYKVKSSLTVYENPWIKVREDKVINISGNDGIFGVIEMKAGSTVLAVNNLLEVYLVKEYKYGIERDSIELMSGGLDEDETPLEAAKRELKEEIGLVAKEWIDLGVVDPFTTVVQSPNYMFLAINIEEGKSSPDEDEKIKIIKVNFFKAVEMVMRSEITHSASCVCILKGYNYLKENNYI